MAIKTASGTLFYIGTTLDTDVASPVTVYDDDSYTLVGEIESLGEVGDEASTVKAASIGDSRVRTLKGARDAGVMDIVCFRDPDDTGQDAMIAAEGTNNEYNFKIVHSDAPSGGTASISYFRGLVMSKRENIGQNDNVVRRNFKVSVNTAITAVDKTP